MNPKELDSLSVRTGLSVSVCAGLLRAGWRYVEEINQPARWVSPIASLKRQTG